MLLSFQLENWTSFRDHAEFSMIAGSERKHRDRLAYVPKYRMYALPVAAIYGGNASGKSNLFKALSFAKRFIVRGTQPDAAIGVKQFLLDNESHSRPSRFAFELLVDGDVYELSFTVNSSRVLEESLIRVLSTSERTLYRRSGSSIEFDMGRSSVRDSELQFLEFAFRGTRDNELFLTNAVSQNVEQLKPVWTWFRDHLHLIDPSSTFIPSELLIDGASPLASQVSEALEALDTGITGLAEETVRLEDVGLPPELEEELRELVKPDSAVRFRNPERNERYVLSRDEKDQIVAGRLVARHTRSDGTEVRFDLRNEADGTQRVIDLLPAFCDLGAVDSNDVYVIDELDRSLHSLLTRQLLCSFLDASGPETRSQLIFTTHDLLLMDQALLRRDEMWVTEREQDGNSLITSISEYQDVRHDNDLRKSYLQGRLGGVPRLLYRQVCQIARNDEACE